MTSPMADETLMKALGEEYYAIVRVIADFDGRLVTVKGWSVTLSLAGLGLGFQQAHYALFGLAAASALGFWYIDAAMKRHQMRYYPRMRDIEVAANELQEQGTADRKGTVLAGFSTPRIDWYWKFTGRLPDERLAAVTRRDPAEVRRSLLLAPLMGHVMLPHAVAVVLGFVLFILAVQDAPGLAQLEP
jgi:hypothetical protein